MDKSVDKIAEVGLVQTGLMVARQGFIKLGVTKESLLKLAGDSSEIVAVKSADARHEAQTARMKLLKQRTGIAAIVEGTIKDIRTQYEENRVSILAEGEALIAIISPEEKRLKSLQDEFDAQEESKRQAAIQEEIDRKNALALKIIKLDHGLEFGDNSAMIAAKIDRITDIEIDDEYQERKDEAIALRKKSIAELCEAFNQVKAQEKAASEHAEAAAIIRREAEAKAEELRIENERKQAEERAARELAEDEAKKQREIAEAAQREADRLKAAEIAEQQRIESAKRAEQERIAAEERAKLEAKAKADREARIKAEHEAAELRAQAEAAEAARKIAEDFRIEAERKAAAAPDKEKMLAYAEALLNVPRPSYETVAAKEAGVNMEQAVLNLHKRIVSKANEL